MKIESNGIVGLLSEQNRRAKRATETIFYKGRDRTPSVKYAREHVRDFLSFFVEDLPLSELPESTWGTVSFSKCSTSSDLSKSVSSDSRASAWSQTEDFSVTVARRAVEEVVSEWDDIVLLLKQVHMLRNETRNVEECAVRGDICQGTNYCVIAAPAQLGICDANDHRERPGLARSCACPFRHARQSRFYP